jgi:hypothetical protein
MNTSTIERISVETGKLPDSYQKEVLHFVEFLLSKTKNGSSDSRQEDLEWYELSLAEAARGIEDDDIPEYTDSDLREKWQ